MINKEVIEQQRQMRKVLSPDGFRGVLDVEKIIDEIDHLILGDRMTLIDAIEYFKWVLDKFEYLEVPESVNSLFEDLKRKVNDKLDELVLRNR